MKIVYLARAVADIGWMRLYYTGVFPEGQKRARHQFRAIERLIRENPLLGHPADIEGVRELVIPRTPFSFIYRVRAERIEVLRIWDNRADRGAMENDRG